MPCPSLLVLSRSLPMKDRPPLIPTLRHKNLVQMQSSIQASFTFMQLRSHFYPPMALSIVLLCMFPSSGGGRSTIVPSPLLVVNLVACCHHWPSGTRSEAGLCWSSLEEHFQQRWPLSKAARAFQKAGKGTCQCPNHESAKVLDGNATPIDRRAFFGQPGAQICPFRHSHQPFSDGHPVPPAPLLDQDSHLPDLPAVVRVAHFNPNPVRNGKDSAQANRWQGTYGPGR